MQYIYWTYWNSDEKDSMQIMATSIKTIDSKEKQRSKYRFCYFENKWRIHICWFPYSTLFTILISFYACACGELREITRVVIEWAQTVLMHINYRIVTCTTVLISKSAEEFSGVLYRALFWQNVYFRSLRNWLDEKRCFLFFHRRKKNASSREIFL